MTKPEDHRHEAGEDRSGCRNCEFAGLAAQMSDFEASAALWYFENVTPFTIEAGLVAEAFRDLRFGPAGRPLFLKAIEKIHLSEKTIEAEKIAELKRGTENG